MQPRSRLLVVAEGQPLVVDDRRARLVVDAKAAASQIEAEIDFLVVAGGEDPVEASPLLEQVPAHEQRGAAAVVDLAGKVVAGVVLVATSSQVPARAVGEYDPARLLQPAVGVDELGSNGSHVRLPDPLQERLEPSRGDDGVVVQEEEVSTARDRCAVICRIEESGVLAMVDYLQPSASDELGEPSFGRGVVDEHYLGQQARIGVTAHALDAGHRLVVTVVRADDHRDGRRWHLAASHVLSSS